jgi:hypothetical protein
VLIAYISFVMIVHKHDLWDAFPQIPFIVIIIESYFVATASISTPLHYVLVFDALVASHIISTSLVNEGQRFLFYHEQECSICL